VATTKMPSSLEIAQQATLRPIAELAEEIGLEDDEIELNGRYKAKTMPGLSATPAAFNVDIDQNGRTVGLF
jgi:formyltetrahydrofolate synthetase